MARSRCDLARSRAQLYAGYKNFRAYNLDLMGSALGDISADESADSTTEVRKNSKHWRPLASTQNKIWILKPIGGFNQVGIHVRWREPNLRPSPRPAPAPAPPPAATSANISANISGISRL